MYRIILASASPRRKEIMETMGIKYEVMASNAEEVVSETRPEEMVKAVAGLKTGPIAQKINETRASGECCVIIGADTMGFLQEHALGKPKDETDAIRMIAMLAGNTHKVITGVNIRILDGSGKNTELSFAVCTEVAVRPMTQEQIEDYVSTGEPMDKAGAYAIQGKFGIFLQGIAGDYYNVMGFPIAEIYAALLEQGIDIKNQ